MADNAPPVPLRSRRRLGLRARVVLAFVVGALLVSGILAGVAYTVTRNNLVDTRERTGIRIAASNAAAVRAQLNVEDVDPAAVLLTLSTPLQSVPTLRLGPDAWLTADPLRFADTDVNSLLLTEVESGQPSQMRYRFSNAPFLVVGVPLPDRDALYFEAIPLRDIDDTLQSLGIALTGGAVVSTIAAAMLGWWAARRVLSPLEEIGEAAEAIAAGELDTRLEAEADRDLGRLTGSFNLMARTLQQRIERDGRFASEVSHELRSPLMTLAASMEVLNNQRSEMPDRAQTALDLLTTDLVRFQGLVEDLLEISRFDVGAVNLQLSRFEVAEFVRQAVGVAGHEVPVTYPKRVEGLFIEADKRRLARVIANLLDNAEKYAGGATGVEINRDGDSVSITVLDEGPGVPAEEREAIFDRFSRGVEGGRRGTGTGVGLGLSLVAEHMNLHGGTVMALPREDGASGTRFVVTLPGVAR
jgi:two-component system sensor histidine kinase MtrB